MAYADTAPKYASSSDYAVVAANFLLRKKAESPLLHANAYLLVSMCNVEITLEISWRKIRKKII